MRLWKPFPTCSCFKDSPLGYLIVQQTRLPEDSAVDTHPRGPTEERTGVCLSPGDKATVSADGQPCERAGQCGHAQRVPSSPCRGVSGGAPPLPDGFVCSARFTAPRRASIQPGFLSGVSLTRHQFFQPHKMSRECLVLLHFLEGSV